MVYLSLRYQEYKSGQGELYMTLSLFWSTASKYILTRLCIYSKNILKHSFQCPIFKVGRVNLLFAVSISD